MNVSSLVRPCAACGRGNRVPVSHLADAGRCGACGAALSPQAEPLEVDGAQFAAIVRQARVPVLVDFWAPWCGPCRMAAPEVAHAAAALSGRAIVLKVNTEEQPELAQRYAIRSIPNFAVFVGGEPVWQQAGLMRSTQLQAAVSQAA